MKRLLCLLLTLACLSASYLTVSADSKAVKIVPGETFSRKLIGGKSKHFLDVQARIESPEAQGAHNCMLVSVNRQPLNGKLTNKPMAFTYEDGREFPYFDPGAGSWLLFYSPDFKTNDSAQAGGYRVKQGQACHYVWDIADMLKNGVANVVVQNDGQAANRPIWVSLKLTD